MRGVRRFFRTRPLLTYHARLCMIVFYIYYVAALRE